MTFGERLTELRKERGFANRNDFANYLGIPSTTLRNYETGAREPGHVFLKQMADIFHVSVDYLLCMTDDRTVHSEKQDITQGEYDRIHKYRILDRYGKEVVDLVLDKEYERCQEQKTAGANNVVLLKEPDRSYLKPEAAHERTDIELTDEGRQHDDDIMNDDSEWE